MRDDLLFYYEQELAYLRRMGAAFAEKYPTCYGTTLWPVTVAGAQWRTPDQWSPPVGATSAAAAVRVVLQCLPDVTFGKLELNTLRLYLNGESNLVATLYELLCNNCEQ